MAPFRHGHDELQHGLPWRLMQNGPITKYLRRDFFEEDTEDLEGLGFEVRRIGRLPWADEGAVHDRLRESLQLPDYTGRNFNALADSLTDIEVPEASGLVAAFDDFEETDGSDLLLQVLAEASRWWLLFGRLVIVLLRIDDPRYEGPVLGRGHPQWNNREWQSASRPNRPAPH
jgi:RNAse (barnase) inhibitor barstar